jgi:hypothetical protein
MNVVWSAIQFERPGSVPGVGSQLTVIVSFWEVPIGMAAELDAT